MAPDVHRSIDRIKGRIAEALVEELFLALDWKVFRFGVEQTYPHLLASVAGQHDVVSRMVRSQPDFLVQRNGGQPLLVEVKYRSNGHLSVADIGEDYPHPTAFVVLVSPHRIQCVTASDLKNGIVLRADRKEYLLASRPEFAADTARVMEFVNLAHKLFQFDKRPLAIERAA